MLDSEIAPTVTSGGGELFKSLFPEQSPPGAGVAWTPPPTEPPQVVEKVVPKLRKPPDDEPPDYDPDADTDDQSDNEEGRGWYKNEYGNWCYDEHWEDEGGDEEYPQEHDDCTELSEDEDEKQF